MESHEMAPKRAKRKPGPPARYGRRPTLTVRLQEPLYRAIKQSAAAHGKSLSEEIEDRLGTCLDLETASRQLEQMRASTDKMHAMAASVLRDAATVRSTERVLALKLAGYQILRETEGRPTRLVVDFETLVSEADGIARGLRSGFVDDKTSPVLKPLRPMTVEEEQRLLAEIEKIKQTLKAAVEETLAADAAAAEGKSGDEAA
jgi:hypothetical protein